MNMIRPVSDLRNKSEIYSKLQEAEREAEYTKTRFSSKDVWKAMREALEE